MFVRVPLALCAKIVIQRQEVNIHSICSLCVHAYTYTYFHNKVYKSSSSTCKFVFVFSVHSSCSSSGTRTSVYHNKFANHVVTCCSAAYFLNVVLYSFISCFFCTFLLQVVSIFCCCCCCCCFLYFSCVKISHIFFHFCSGCILFLSPLLYCRFVAKKRGRKNSVVSLVVIHSSTALAVATAALAQ